MQVVCACVLALQKYHECSETALPVSKPCKYIYDFWVILQKTNSGNIAEVVARLAKTPLPKGWPVPLTLGCNVDGSTSAPSTDGGVGSSVGGKKKKNGTVKSKV